MTHGQKNASQKKEGMAKKMRHKKTKKVFEGPIREGDVTLKGKSPLLTNKHTSTHKTTKIASS